MREGSRQIIEKLLAPKNNAGLVSYVNLYSYGILRRLPEKLLAMDHVHLDGFLMVWIFKMIGCDAKRQSFDMGSMAAEVLKRAEEKSQSIAFIGGLPNVAEKAVEVLRQRFPMLHVAITSSGFFRDDQDRTIRIERVAAAKPDVVIVGMGAGLQEQMLIDLKSAGFSGTGYTCGGFLHQTAKGKVEYYPAWINRLGARWLYRCAREPKVIFRVLNSYPLNTIYLLYDLLKYKLK